MERLFNFLTDIGYNTGTVEHNTFSKTHKFYKRIDADLKDVPVCASNDKLSIHVEYNNVKTRDIEQESVEVEIVAETVDKFWVECRMYALKPEEYIDNYKKIVDKLVIMWIVSNT